MDRDLKHFEMYVQRIQMYAESMQIKLEYSDADGEGAYIPSRNKIRVDPDLSESREIAVLLHELGHALDDTLADAKTYGAIERAYKRVYRGRTTPAQRQLVIECEERAWEYGARLAKKLGIRLGKWYSGIRDENLGTYRRRE